MISITFSLSLELCMTMMGSCMLLENSLLSVEREDPCLTRMITVLTMFAQESSLLCSLTSFKKQELVSASGNLKILVFHSGDRVFITSQRWPAQGVIGVLTVTTHKLGSPGRKLTTLHRLVSNIMVEVLSSYPGILTTVHSPKLSLKQPMTVI